MLVSVHFKGCLDEHLQSVLVNYSLGAIVTKCFIKCIDSGEGRTKVDILIINR